MKTLPRMHRRDEHPPQRRDIPPARPRAVAADRLPCVPGTARTVLDELIADTRPVSPTALRHAHDHGTWLPVSVGLRAVPLHRVPLADLDENLAAVKTLLAAHPCPRLDTTVQILLAPIAAMLAEVDAR